MWFEGGRIDALVRCGGSVLRTSAGASMQVGIAQVRRKLEGGVLSVRHLLFAPLEPRPLLLACVELENRGSVPLRVDYTELWDVAGSGVRAEPGACVCDTPEGPRALADASVAIRAEAPDPLPERGLALDLRMGLPPLATRRLEFAYAAPSVNGAPGPLVQAWRGRVRASLAATVAGWLHQIQEGVQEGVGRGVDPADTRSEEGHRDVDDPIESYRRLAQRIHGA